MSATRPQLLLVEDHDLDAEAIGRLIRRHRIDVSLARARDGLEAHELLLHAAESSAETGTPRCPPYIVLLDINMPRMTGVELLQELRGEPWYTELPVYVLSSSELPQERSHLQKLGVAGQLTKPIKLDELQQLLAEQRRQSACRDTGNHPSAE